MTNWMRKATLLVTLVSLMAMLTACGGTKAPELPQNPAKAADPAPAPVEQKPVDKGEILTEAAINYFNNLPANSNMIPAADLKAKVDAKDATIFLLDIRRPEDFAKGHLEGATNIAFGALGANLDKLPKDKQLVVNCYSGQTSGQAVAVLKLAGYNAVSLQGGFPSFEKAGFEIKQ